LIRTGCGPWLVFPDRDYTCSDDGKCPLEKYCGRWRPLHDYDAPEEDSWSLSLQQGVTAPFIRRFVENAQVSHDDSFPKTKNFEETPQTMYVATESLIVRFLHRLVTVDTPPGPIARILLSTSNSRDGVGILVLGVAGGLQILVKTRTCIKTAQRRT
jgi:hypothetical protein